VVIALEDLDPNNGLPILDEVVSLPYGGFIVLSGDHDIKFNNKGGGLAFFILLQF
jgi:hypothetical protein